MTRGRSGLQLPQKPSGVREPNEVLAGTVYALGFPGEDLLCPWFRLSATRELDIHQSFSQTLSA